MNARVEAGPMLTSISMVSKGISVSTEVNAAYSINNAVLWTCFSPATISINGHSLNAINPDFEVGELTTSILA